MSGETELFVLLRQVSRSFYISVRLLPKRIRMAIALGYLLARASDTIADTNQLPPEERIGLLDRFLRSVLNQAPEDPLDLAACLTAQADEPEKGAARQYRSGIRFPLKNTTGPAGALRRSADPDHPWSDSRHREI